MSKFCKICDNLIYPLFYNDELAFKCMACNISYKSDDSDTLRHERIKEVNIIIYENILKNSRNDPAVGLAHVKCIKAGCDGNLVKTVRVGDDMKLFNICRKCGIIFLN